MGSSIFFLGVPSPKAFLPVRQGFHRKVPAATTPFHSPLHPPRWFSRCGCSRRSPFNGESETRQYILENALLEPLIALPEQLFYNTGIATYV